MERSKRVRTVATCMAVFALIGLTGCKKKVKGAYPPVEYYIESYDAYSAQQEEERMENIYGPDYKKKTKVVNHENLEKKIYEPGKHNVISFVEVDLSNLPELESIDEPEGYDLKSTTFQYGLYNRKDVCAFTFENTVTVEVLPEIDTYTGEFKYDHFGTPVDVKELTKN